MDESYEEKRKSKKHERRIEMAVKHKIKLGKDYKHKNYGIKGRATAICYYETGCTQIQISCVHGGDVKHHWFDLQNLKEYKERKKAKIPGGPQNHPPSRHP